MRPTQDVGQWERRIKARLAWLQVQTQATIKRDRYGVTVHMPAHPTAHLTTLRQAEQHLIHHLRAQGGPTP